MTDSNEILLRGVNHKVNVPGAYASPYEYLYLYDRGIAEYPELDIKFQINGFQANNNKRPTRNGLYIYWFSNPELRLIKITRQGKVDYSLPNYWNLSIAVAVEHDLVFYFQNLPNNDILLEISHPGLELELLASEIIPSPLPIRTTFRKTICGVTHDQKVEVLPNPVSYYPPGLIFDHPIENLRFCGVNYIGFCRDNYYQLFDFNGECKKLNTSHELMELSKPGDYAIVNHDNELEIYRQFELSEQIKIPEKVLSTSNFNSSCYIETRYRTYQLVDLTDNQGI